MKNNNVGYHPAAGSRPYKQNQAGRGVGPIDPQLSPLSTITRAKGGGKTAPVPKVGYSQAGK